MQTAIICSLQVSTITHPGMWVDHASERWRNRRPSRSFSRLRVGASSSRSRSSLTARPRLFEGHHSLFRSRLRPRLLSRILPGVNSNADLWNVSHSPALPLRPPPQDHSMCTFSHSNSRPPLADSSPRKKYGERRLKRRNHADVILRCMSLSILGSY